VLAGRNWARLLLMFSCVLAMTFAFIGNARGVDLIALTELPSVAASILVLLALSSHRARGLRSPWTAPSQGGCASNSEGAASLKRVPKLRHEHNRLLRPTD